jgi:hypothetical protein
MSTDIEEIKSAGKAVIYSRAASVLADDVEDELERRSHRCRKYAGQKGYEVLGRDLSAYLELKNAIKARGGILESPVFNFDDQPDTAFVEHVSIALAQWEDAITSDPDLFERLRRLSKGPLRKRS